MTIGDALTIIGGILAVSLFNLAILRFVLEQSFKGVDARFAAVLARFDALGNRFDVVDRQLGSIETKVDNVADALADHVREGHNHG